MYGKSCVIASQCEDDVWCMNLWCVIVDFILFSNFSLRKLSKKSKNFFGKVDFLIFYDVQNSVLHISHLTCAMNFRLVVVTLHFLKLFLMPSFTFLSNSFVLLHILYIV